MSRLKIVNGSEVLITTPYTGTGSGDSTVRGDLIKAPVSIDDVNTVIVGASNDLGTLCKKNDSINWWAKYRPFLANKKKNNASYCLGLANGSSSGAISSTAEGYGNAIGLNYYGNSGAADTDEDYRYDLPLALGTVQVGQGTPSNIHTPVYFNSSSKKIIDVRWNVKANSNFDSKFYRLTDFNGYCHIARPKEVCYFSEKISKNYFGIEVSSTASSNPIKEYCLSCSFLFDSSNPTYSGLTLGVLFTDESSDTGESLVINTRARICYSESLGNGILGSSKKSNSSSNSFYIVDFNGSSGKEITSYVLRDLSGYKDNTTSPTTSQNPFWVLTKIGNSQFHLDIYPENFPSNYSNWFKAGKTYTVQLVMTNSGYNDQNRFAIVYFQDTVTGSNYLINQDVYSLNLNTTIINNVTTGCFCKRGIEYTTVPTSNKILYDNREAALNNQTVIPQVPRPSYDISVTNVTVGSNKLQATRASQNVTDTTYNLTYGVWNFVNYGDINSGDYSYFEITMAIDNYVVPRNSQNISEDRGITINLNTELDTTSLSNKNFKDRSSEHYASSFLPVYFSDIFETGPVEIYSISKDTTYNSSVIDHTMLTSMGTYYKGTVKIKYYFKVKSNPKNLAMLTTDLNNYVTNSSHIDIFFNEYPSVKMILNIPKT